MSKLMEDMRNEAAILSAIGTARFYNIPEGTILTDIMKCFDLTEKQAKEYMLK
ncbi:MAG: hypothetical protein LIP10_09160 [Clostridiales bacterium]|nr:hypothetical protein [Clostridiales bacterium]